MDLPGLVTRPVRAAMLDVDLYNAVEADATLNRQAALLVATVTALAGVGSAFATESNPALGAVFGAATGLIGWVVWSWLSFLVGVRFFGGTADYGEMLRVIAYAYAPLAIGVIPWLGFVGAIWALVAAVIAVREGMDFSTPRAVATMAAGWVTWFALAVVVQAALGLELGGVWQL